MTWIFGLAFALWAVLPDSMRAWLVKRGLDFSLAIAGQLGKRLEDRIGGPKSTRIFKNALRSTLANGVRNGLARASADLKPEARRMFEDAAEFSLARTRVLDALTNVVVSLPGAFDIDTIPASEESSAVQNSIATVAEAMYTAGYDDSTALVVAPKFARELLSSLDRAVTQYASEPGSPLANWVILARQEASHRLTRRIAGLVDVPQNRAGDIAGRCLRELLSTPSDKLATFNERIRRLRMAGLRGSPEDASKRYLPHVYVARSSLDSAVQTFLRGENLAFAVVGDSGVGKTNQLCAWAEQFSADHIVLFYNGAELEAPLTRLIALDLGWDTADGEARLHLPRVLTEAVPPRGERRLIIIVDALDEVSEAIVPGFVRDLDALVRGLHRLAGEGPCLGVRLIVSCKSGDWSRFAMTGDSPSALSEALLPTAQQTGFDESVVRRPDVTTGNTTTAMVSPAWPPARLPLRVDRFTPAERDRAITLYSGAFEFLPPRGTLREECTHPFMLRVVAETYSTSGETPPPDLGEIELLRAFLSRKLRQIATDERSRRRSEAQLDAVGRARLTVSSNPLTVAASGANSLQVRAASLREGVTDEAVHAEFTAAAAYIPAPDPGWVSEDIVRASLATSSDEPIEPGLTAQGLLVTHTDPDGRRSLRFAYRRLEEYVIARRVLRLDALSPEEFREKLPALLGRTVAERALLWHLRHAPATQRVVLSTTLRGRAMLFLETYERLRDTVFAGIRELPPVSRTPRYARYDAGDGGGVSDGGEAAAVHAGVQARGRAPGE